MSADWQNKPYFGDNFEILRDPVGDESVDLIYLAVKLGPQQEKLAHDTENVNAATDDMGNPR